jgi:DNA (cytosine-5)-methyltransferase 1
MKNFVDLFSGGGLGARGAVMAGMTPILAVDMWDKACDTYKANFPTAVALNQKVDEINPLDHVRREDVDLLLASPECTNHSVAKGAAPRSEESKETALHTVDWIATLMPRWFVIENVKEMKDWDRYDELLDLLRALGYQLREQVINAAEFGAPQSRVRLFLIGGLGQTPPEIAPDPSVRPMTVRDILDPDDRWKFTPVFTKTRAKNTAARARNAIATLGDDAEFLIVYYGSGGDRSWQTLDEPLRTVTCVDRFALVRKIDGEWKMRMLQVPEIARAMSLPPEHAFTVGSRRERIKLCGNGVCAEVMKRIVTQLKAATPVPRSSKGRASRRTPVSA